MTQPLEKHDIQSLVLTGFPEHDHACFVLLSVVDPRPARQWVGRLARVVSTTATRPKQGLVNVAFSAAGLRALGLPADSLETFQSEFQEGMTGRSGLDASAAPHRSRILGDTGTSDPASWVWGGPQQPVVHAALFIYAKSAAELAELLATERAEYQGVKELYLRDTFKLPDRREHFGFADGIAQPDVEGSGAKSRKDGAAPAVKAGEFVLGYENEYGKLPASPTLAAALDPSQSLGPAAPELRDLGRNGTYLVVRQLDQDVWIKTSSCSGARWTNRVATAAPPIAKPRLGWRPSASGDGRAERRWFAPPTATTRASATTTASAFATISRGGSARSRRTFAAPTRVTRWSPVPKRHSWS
jgi:deferrochelatase/peroxidase EfeB